MNLISLHPPPSRRANHARIKRWTRVLLRLEADVTITIHEVRCSKPGCRDLETVIGIFRGSGHWGRLRVAGAAADVTRANLRSAVDKAPRGNP